MGLMSTRDFNNYKTLFDSMVNVIQPPNLLIYLRATVPTLVNQIQKQDELYNFPLDIVKLNSKENKILNQIISDLEHASSLGRPGTGNINVIARLFAQNHSFH